MLSIYILGHNGYIGKNLFHFFKKKNIKVKGFSSREQNLLAKNSIKFLQSKIKNNSILIICSAIKSTVSNKFDTLTLNNKIIENIAKGIVGKKLKKVIYISSCAIYGVDINHRSINELCAEKPDTFYSISKFYAEKLLKLVVPEKNLIFIRPTIVYGHNEPVYQSSPSGFLKLLHKKKPINIWGDGTEIRNFIFIDDLVLKIYQILKNNFCGKIILSGENSSYLNIIKIIKKTLIKKIVFHSKKRTKKKINKTYKSLFEKNLFKNFKITKISEGLEIILKKDYGYDL